MYRAVFVMQLSCSLKKKIKWIVARSRDACVQSHVFVVIQLSCSVKKIFISCFLKKKISESN